MNVKSVSSGVYTVSGLCADHPEFLLKWGWFIEYVGSVMGDRKYGNTALVAFGLKSANDGNLVTGSLNYCDRTITNSISNCLNTSKENLHGGSSSGATPADFSSLEKYDVAVISAAHSTGLAAAKTKAAADTTAAAEAVTAAEEAKTAAAATRDGKLISFDPSYDDLYTNLYK